jgi:hypothetical protein
MPFRSLGLTRGLVVLTLAAVLTGGAVWAADMMTRSVVASVEIGVPIVDDYEVYDFKLEARVGFFF